MIDLLMLLLLFIIAVALVVVLIRSSDRRMLLDPRRTADEIWRSRLTDNLQMIISGVQDDYATHDKALEQLSESIVRLEHTVSVLETTISKLRSCENCPLHCNEKPPGV